MYLRLSNCLIIAVKFWLLYLHLGGRTGIKYSIYSGDPDGLFRIDSITGSIHTASELDHEARPTILLNIQATNGDPPAYGHTQVRISL